MYSKKAVVLSEIGLYGRSATAFIQLANTFKSSVFVEYAEKKANAKSLLGILSLAIANNTEITISAEGADEVEAVTKMTDFVSSGCTLERPSDDVIEGSVDPKK